MKLTLKELKILIAEAIKKQTELPPGTKITRVPPGEANAVSLKRLRQDAEQAATHGQSRIPVGRDQREKEHEKLVGDDDLADQMMHNAEQEMEFWADERAAGVPTDTSWKNHDFTFGRRGR